MRYNMKVVIIGTRTYTNVILNILQLNSDFEVAGFTEGNRELQVITI